MEINENKPEPMHPFVDIDGFIADGKQFDLDIVLANDHRDVIYGVVRDCFKEPVKDAVVKLVEVDFKFGKKELKPVSHTFTDDEGEFVFGPLCPGKKYAIQIWKDDVKHIKVCAKCHHEGKCLKGEKHEKCDCFIDDEKDCHKEDKKHECKDEKWDCCKEDKKTGCKEDKWDCHKDEKKSECKEEKWDCCKEDKKPEHKEDKCDCCKEEKYDDFKNKCWKR